MCMGDVSVGWVYFADVVKWGSLAVGDPVEESYRGMRVQRAGGKYTLQESCRSNGPPCISLSTDSQILRFSDSHSQK